MDCVHGAQIGTAGGNQRRGHTALLPQTRLSSGRPLHGKKIAGRPVPAHAETECVKCVTTVYRGTVDPVWSIHGVVVVQAVYRG